MAPYRSNIQFSFLIHNWIACWNSLRTLNRVQPCRKTSAQPPEPPMQLVAQTQRPVSHCEALTCQQIVPQAQNPWPWLNEPQEQLLQGSVRCHPASTDRRGSWGDSYCVSPHVTVQPSESEPGQTPSPATEVGPSKTLQTTAPPLYPKVNAAEEGTPQKAFLENAPPAVLTSTTW